MAESSNPKLQQLLASLNGHSTLSPNNQTDEHLAKPMITPYDHSQTTPQVQASSIPGLGFLPATPRPRPFPPEPTTYQRPLTPTSTQSHAAPTPRANTPSVSSQLASPAPSVPDASAITTWPAALKHVTKHLANNPAVAARIRKLISNQHDNEQQWWKIREGIVTRQNSRPGTSAQVSALLLSLGGTDSASSGSDDPAANQAELDVYDMKVYKSLLAMAADFDRQLRASGVPFFAIKHELVILEEGREKAGVVKGRLDKGELKELQRRMLTFLEELFGD